MDFSFPIHIGQFVRWMFCSLDLICHGRLSIIIGVIWIVMGFVSANLLDLWAEFEDNYYNLCYKWFSFA